MRPEKIYYPFMSDKMFRVNSSKKWIFEVIWVLAWISMAAMCGSVLAQDENLDGRIKNKEGELRKLRNEIKEQRKKIREVEDKEKDEEKYLHKLEKEEKLVRELLKGVAEKELLLEERVEGLRGELSVNEKIYLKRLEIFSDRIRNIYKHRNRQMWQELLAARGVADLLQRYRFFTVIAERDAALINNALRKKDEIQQQEAEITELLHQVVMGKREKERELSKLEKLEKERENSLAMLNEKKRKYQQRVDELARAEEKVRDLIESLERRRAERAEEWGIFGEKNFPGLKGNMPLPVEGKVVRGFGKSRHPEYGTVTYNTGVDIEAEEGVPVTAVARGRVEYASILKGFGNCIIINHGNGYYTIYAHVHRVLVKRDEQIERGDLIAEMGIGDSSTGVMHFEIRKSKESLNPQKWFGP
jgi:septal ring factor EnvC (AmiA/AmiB activator)